MELRHNQEQPILSVSEFVEYINLALGQRRVSVEGEISGYHLNQGKWIFFDLKDEDSKIGCFAPAWNVRMALEDGMHVLVHGAPRIYGKSGKFSIMVDAIELVGEGALRRAFELTKKKLEHEGLFAPERKRPLPQFPRVIGVIASRESAAYTDFIRIVNARVKGVDIYLYHVQVQGAHAADDIVRACGWFNDHAHQYGIESLALIRGGGSLEDLQAFNSEQVARAVFGSTLPVICGVGHERDESLADYTADVRASTPTHAAALIVPDQREVAASLSRDCSLFARSLEYAVEWHAHAIQTQLSVMSQVFHRTTLRVAELSHALLRSEEQIVNNLRMMRQGCTQKAQRLTDMMSHACQEHENALRFLSRSLEQINPLTVLKRGYTITRRGGAVLVRAQDLNARDPIDIQFADGTIRADVR